MPERHDVPSDWEAVVKADAGHIFYDAIKEGVRVIVMRGPAALCAYLGVPKDHPLAGFDYNDLPMQVHGGLTFGSAPEEGWPQGWFWYGWDYAHAGDWSTYDDERRDPPPWKSDAKKWTVPEVVAEAKDACWDFRKLMKLAEKCALKDSGYLIARKDQ